ncbi:hypothetical protein V6N11_044208 [Hibiscus sabdariffa]|uniref:Uncharacterized protein n=2 Tax=Hibiscus sabdariffa TaxID=183260 RepID=A0ABR2REJ6_9ROSI
MIGRRFPFQTPQKELHFSPTFQRFALRTSKKTVRLQLWDSCGVEGKKSDYLQNWIQATCLRERFDCERGSMPHWFAFWWLH